MSNKTGGRERFLAILTILKEETDELHCLTANQIHDILLEKFRIEADRRSIRSDINTMKKAGIVADASKYSSVNERGSYFTDHIFETWELKMLMDGISQTDYFKPETLNKITDKIFSLAGPSDRKILEKNRPILNYHINASDYYLATNLDSLLAAIKTNHPVYFEYFKLDSKKKPQLYENSPYKVHPFRIAKRHAFYYLLCYQESSEKFKTFRIDRIRNIQIIESEHCLNPETLPSGDATDKINNFLRNNTDSFSGKHFFIIVDFQQNPSVLYDVFGIENVSCIDNTQNNTATAETFFSNGHSSCQHLFSIETQNSDGLYHNLLKLGDALTILHPVSVRNKFIQMLNNMLSNYPHDK